MRAYTNTLFRHRFSVLLLAGALACAAVPAAADAPVWTDVPAAVCAGAALKYSFTADAGTVSVVLKDASGETAAVIRSELAVTDGVNTFWWNGTVNGQPVAEGEYSLSVTSPGGTAEVPITVADTAPVFVSVIPDAEVTSSWFAAVTVTKAGTLTASITLDGTAYTIISQEAHAGENTVYWDGTVNGQTLAAGDRDITFRITDTDGVSAVPEVVTVTVSAPHGLIDTEYHTPSERLNEDFGDTFDYWTLNQGELDESLVWQVLTQPITVIDGSQRHQVKLRAEPSAKCTDYTGEVTCESQGVRVLKAEGEWSYVASYSSSVEGSPVKVWAAPCAGWIETDRLKTKEVSQKYGVVIDKLKQRLYVYKGGKLFSTLLCSTGFSKKSTPYNETPAGEFITISWSGGFWSGDLWCDMGIRINDGILLHEVPSIMRDNGDGTTKQDWSRCERYLGDRASHGCIRIQKRLTPERVNMHWLWDNLERQKTKVIIWDDFGRQLEAPDADYPLYYNPNKGTMYHSSATCAEVSERLWPLTRFTYGELDEKPYSKLTACPACAPLPRQDVIDKLNQDARK